jgi:hypothetical protein
LGDGVGGEFEAFRCDVEGLFVPSQGVAECGDAVFESGHLEVVLPLAGVKGVDDALDDGEGSLGSPLAIAQYVEC